MKQHFSTAAIAFITTLFIGSLAQADNLGQFDARSLAMGGAGVAGAQSANAAAYNPALMATESNKKRFSMIPFAIKIDAYDENGFADNIDDVDEAINDDDDGLKALLDNLDDLTETTCGGDKCYIPNNPNDMTLTADKADETSGYLIDLNSSNALINANAGVAIQLGQKIPMAIIVDGGASVRLGLKFAQSDTNELTTYTDVMADDKITLAEVTDLASQGLVEVDTSGGPGNDKISFVRGSDTAEGDELQSLIEVIGARYAETGISFADSFQYMGKELAVGITPKVVKVEAIKYHQLAEDDFESGDVFDDENIASKTDFNADVGAVFKPFDTQPLQVGLTVKNLFTRSYDLKKSAREEAVEAAASAGDEDAQADLAAFKFKQSLKIEPQITAGVAYDLRFFNLLADLDLNEAEVLGRTTQHLALGAEFDIRLIRFQLGYKTAIGGDEEDDTLSAGTSLGPLGLAVISSGDHLGGVIQFGFSF